MELPRRSTINATIIDAPVLNGNVTNAVDGNQSNHTAPKPSQPTFLDQGWTDEKRATYYESAQGSMLVPFDWFMALEQANNEKPFYDHEHMDSLGFIRDTPGKKLPLGFVKSIGDGKEWLGMTCAACHTGEIDYKGKSVRVDGGTNIIDINEFESQLVEALRATSATPQRFARFAKHVGGDQSKLHQDLNQFTEKLGSRVTRSRPEHRTGFARWDAVNVLINEVDGTAVSQPENYRVPHMPVSYPSVWLTPKFNKVLWNASVHSLIARNVGEVIIVYGQAHIGGDADNLSYSTSADIPKLVDLYDVLADLQPPKWPEAVLGKIDTKRAERGMAIYEREGCAKCHGNKPPYTDLMTEPNKFDQKFIDTKAYPLQEVGTDPTYAMDFVQRTAKVGKLKNIFKGSVLEGVKEMDDVPAALMFLAALTAITETKLAELNYDEAQMLAAAGFREPDPFPKNEKELKALIQSLLGYKAQPLAGVWSTAPYLHNGSISSLHDLLLPPEKRAKKFYLGSREFDPKHVGYDPKPSAGATVVDTSIVGNGNGGHTYGTNITDEERWDLLEYLKTL